MRCCGCLQEMISNKTGVQARRLLDERLFTCWKTPSGVRTAWTTWPEPPHVLQVDADVPAFMPEPVHAPHASNRLTSISLLQRK
jgi:hypothetical protein